MVRAVRGEGYTLPVAGELQYTHTYVGAVKSSRVESVAASAGGARELGEMRLPLRAGLRMLRDHAIAPTRPRPMKPSLTPKLKELNVCGWQAVSTLFAQHPGEVKRLFFDASTGKRAGDFCQQLAQHKKVYRQVESAELEKISATKLHGGIVAVIDERPVKKVTREVLADWGRTQASLLLLDRVSNANNVGAIVRTAAFFGVKSIIVADHPGQALPGDAAYRVAEGGMEFVDFYRVPTLTPFCAELKRTHFLLGTSLRGNQLPPDEVRARGLPRPPAVILGNEEKGISPELAAQCDRLIKIPGADSVESLNVSAAAAVLCWEFFGKR